MKKSSAKKVKRRKKVNFTKVKNKPQKSRHEAKKLKKEEPLKINMPLEQAIKIITQPVQNPKKV